MPELPEVEFARSCLERWLVGKKLAKVEADRTRLIRGASVADVEALGGHRVKRIARKGKLLLWELDAGISVLSHLGMTGKFELQKPGDPDVRWSRVRFTRADGARVHFQDQRQFGRFLPGPIEVVRNEEGFRTLGRDAWEEPFSPKELHSALTGRKRAVKDVLMDQTVLAGVGNIQATEALWKAGIHPSRPASSLTEAECARLMKGIHWTLKRTLEMNKGDKISYVEEGEVDNPFLIYARSGEPCPKCGRTLEKIVIGGRTSAFCPKCQPLGTGR
jgi:formamidopyrimidine-DNA glycosylase